MNILKDLCYGNLFSFEQPDYRKEDYQELEELCKKNKAKLLSLLDAPQQEALTLLQDAQEERDLLLQCAAFITGFRLASQLFTAALGM